MQCFDGNWASAKGKAEWECEDEKQFEVRVSSTQVVQLRGYNLDRDDSVLLHAGSGFRLRFDIRGSDYDLLQLVQPSGKEFGYSVRPISRQNGEPINHDDPPAAPMPNNSNLLLQVRNMMREEARARSGTRVFEPEDFPWADRYAIDEDDDDFEEEIQEKREAELQRLREEEENPNLPLEEAPQEPPETQREPEIDNHDKIAAE